MPENEPEVADNTVPRVTDSDAAPALAGEAAEAPARRTRRRATKAAAASETADQPPGSAEEPATRPTRRRSRAASTPAASASVAGTLPADETPETGNVGESTSIGDDTPARAPRTRRRAAKASAPAAVEPDAPVAEPSAAGSALAGLEPAAATPAGDEPAAQPTGSRRRRAAPPATVLFMPPAETAAEPPPAVAAAEAPADESEAGRTSRRRRGRRAAEPVEPVAEAEAEEDEADEDDGDETAAARRRRRRGRRGRGRGKGGFEGDDQDESADAEEADESDAVEEPAAADSDDEGGTLTRRRRTRRRRGAADADTAPDDSVPTVVRIREPRSGRDEVQGVTGSTRLEAKRQRRRDGREQRRTRPPILSESEFLARREAVDRVMVVRQKGDRTQIAVLEDGVLVEHYVTRASASTMVGNVYLGRVQNVLPSMEAAFVDIGRGRNAVLYAGEVNWDATGLEGRTRTIEQALKSGDSVLVQVTKDPIGTKGARLTSHIALSGRHLVYVPHGNASGISRKLSDVERKRLRDVLKNLVPDGAGVIVRTAAEGASEDELARDVKRLQAQWEDIQVKSGEGSAPVLLYEEPDLVIRVVRDLFNEDFRELVVQGQGSYEMVEPYLQHVSPDLVPRMRRYTGTGDAFHDMRLDEQLLKALDRKVFLPSGGSLVIDRTEAMTVVDVNTGKYTGAGGNLEETVTRNNLEAAEEIVRQLRLRDLGGIVVIDFIDMVLESNRELVLRRLTECLGRDRTKHQVTEITSLGLVQMTRKRVGQGLLEAFSEPCEVCRGRGLIIHSEPVADKRSGPAKVAAASATNGSGATAARVDEPVESGRGNGRRRGRKAAVTVEVSEVDSDTDEDLDAHEAADAGQDVALAVGFDADGLDEADAAADGELEEVPRRRTRRGGTRRRTRP